MKFCIFALFRLLPTLTFQRRRISQPIRLIFVLLHVRNPDEKGLLKNKNQIQVK
jgi:hypothetical protein